MHLNLLGKRSVRGGRGGGAALPMAVRPRVGERRKGMRTVGGWGASPPEESLPVKLTIEMDYL
jgi:hypothetical protein